MYFAYWGMYLNYNWYDLIIMSDAFELTFDIHHLISNVDHLNNYLCALGLESGRFAAPFFLIARSVLS